jgi:aspartate carbamoyltransferase catalytic subunit
MENRSLVTIAEHSKEKILYLLEMAKEFEKKPNRKILDGKVVATLFFEPSTRTRLSFETAANRLGARVIGFTDPKATSSSKGETLKDTIIMVSNYADIICMRHYLEGAARYASEVTNTPIVNAGDGSNQHPSQTMLDLYSIYKTQGTLENLNIYMVGDLKYGRTVHSLIEAMSRYEGIKFVMISPNELKIPGFIRYNVLERHNIPYTEVTSMEEAIPQLDVLYMTRIQRERFDDPWDYERLKDSYILTADKMDLAKEKMCVLHPLPRVNEISVKVDDDPRAAYFRQALNGKYMRMALILKLLEEAKDPVKVEIDTTDLVYDRVCINPKCITAVEQELPQIAKITDKAAGIHRCIYCEQKV